MQEKLVLQPENNKKTAPNWIRYSIISLITLTFFTGIVIFSISTYVGWNLTHPVREPLTTTPSSLGLAYEDIWFTSRDDGLNLKGWLVKSSDSSKTVIFAHGYRKNRLQEDVPGLSLAKALKDEGYNVLMFDFRNSGESDGSLTSVGQYEIRDLLGAIDYVKKQPEMSRQIVLLGFSMGASTAILAGSREPAIAAVVADSPFADLKSYLNENLSVWTELPSFPFNQAFFLVMPALTNIKMETVSPVKEISNMGGRPLLLIHGDADIDIPLVNSELLAVAYTNSQLLTVHGGTHVKNYEANPDLYLDTLFKFLNKIQ